MGESGPSGDRNSGDSSLELVRATYDWGSTSPSIAIVEIIAAIEDVDPVALSRDGGITLNDHLDPGALDALLGDGRGTKPTVNVDVADYAVRIDDRGLVVKRSRIRAQ